MIERHYKTAELAEHLSLHPETVRRAAKSGKLRSRRFGLERRYPESAVLAWLESLSSGKSR